MLAVEGCYWAVPGEIVFLDIRDPERLPFPELDRFGELVEHEGWVDDEKFELTREQLVRKRDGALYDFLPASEQAILDEDSELMEYRQETVRYRIPRS